MSIYRCNYYAFGLQTDPEYVVELVPPEEEPYEKRSQSGGRHEDH